MLTALPAHRSQSLQPTEPAASAVEPMFDSEREWGATMSEAVVMARCPQCKKLQPHRTGGFGSDPDGKKYQTMTCTKCRTSTKVYAGQGGEKFQENYDFPDNTDVGDEATE